MFGCSNEVKNWFALRHLIKRVWATSEQMFK